MGSVQCLPECLDLHCACHSLSKSGLQTLAHDGVGGLYKGFGPAIARSFPANGACFLVYELVSSALTSVAKEPTPEIFATDAGR